MGDFREKSTKRKCKCKVKCKCKEKKFASFTLDPNTAESQNIPIAVSPDVTTFAVIALKPKGKSKTVLLNATVGIANLATSLLTFTGLEV